MIKNYQIHKKRIFTNYFTTISIVVLALCLLLAPSLSMSHVNAQEQSAEAACETLKVIDDSGSCAQKTNDVSIGSGLETALNLLSFVAGVIAVIMIMLAGTRYVTSQGDPQKTTQAKNAIIYSTIGIVVAALAQVIVRFVLGVAASP